MHTVLPIGSFDWDPEVAPVAEFEDRLEKIQAIMRDRGWDGLVVYGDVRNFGGLVHVGNIVPKMAWVMILIPQKGAPRLTARGTARMIAATGAQTWIEDIRAAGNPEAPLVEWLAELPGANGGDRTIGLYGADFMTSAIYGIVTKACGSARLVDADEVLAPLAAAQSPNKLDLTRQSCRILTKVCDSIANAHADGATVVEAILEGEREGRANAAQAVRTLFSLDRGETLRPFDRLSDVKSDPLAAYVAVLFNGYFAEGLVTISSAPGPARAAAAEGLQALIEAAKPGASCRELASLCDKKTAPFAPHPITAGSIGREVGLLREQAPPLPAGDDVGLAADTIYSLRVGTTDPKQGHALLSAMVYVVGDGNELLWSAI